MTLKNIEQVRFRAARFADQRDWNQFHTPTNLVLALTGEVGEVAEIFQWKGSNYAYSKLPENEREHIGEELSDVFIYATRLCSQCNVDLSLCVKHYIRGLPAESLQSVRPSDGKIEWDNTTDFDDIYDSLGALNENPRLYCMRLTSRAGALAAQFSDKMECGVGLLDWKKKELANFGFTMAGIIVLLASIAKLMNLNIGSCIASKMAKNEAKYPADKSKGSSAKYTAYLAVKPNGNLNSAIVGFSLFMLGLLLGRRFAC